MTKGVFSARRTLALWAAVSIALAAGAWWLGARVESRSQAAARAAPPPPSVITAPVEFRALVRRTVTRGTVKAQREEIVRVEGEPAEGRPVITGVHVALGRTVREGQALVDVAERPVFVFRGRIPMYRDLTIGAQGRDVRQLQQALARLGYPSWDRPGVFGPRTGAAVLRFYQAKGYTATVPAPTAQPERSPKPSAASAPERDHASTPEAAGVRVGVNEAVFVNRLPARVTAVSAAVRGKADGELLRLAGDRLIVTASLSQEAKRDVRPGDRVEIEDEALGKRYAGRVTTVRERAPATAKRGEDEEPQGDSADEGAYVVTVKTDRSLPLSMRGRDVRVAVKSGGSGRKALVVPLASVVTRADGHAHVTVLASGGAKREVPVELGLAVDGFVELTGSPKLAAGEEVVVGQERPG
ncbi:hypothetical protein DP939_26410 [Spongiactinospora rosea]|uniref:Peptidoglycan binding-like domain-containing protein n=1 Tax=Spongiactinospora rosea TaxID=2248750 RepID=A0A366LSY4_9ACTN|nr:peptidoglycan-binding domain-containing protein [Spongiactinospora rosea]RBQ17028.1 hypothetical protein DP939_26410 [Spongiactinospora rosea]